MVEKVNIDCWVALTSKDGVVWRPEGFVETEWEAVECGAASGLYYKVAFCSVPEELVK